MAETIKRLTIEGFKSIRKLENFELSSLNVLIGPNGAGKSNFVGFFRLLRELIEQRLQVTLATVEGGADACLHLGPKITPEFSAKLHFGENGYDIALVPTPDNRLVFSREIALWERYVPVETDLGSGHSEAKLKDKKDKPGRSGAPFGVPHYVFEAISNWVVYHFHDTSLTAAVRRPRAINDNEFLRASAENLAPFLYRLRRSHPVCYAQIRNVVRLAAPFFDDFKLRPMPATPDMIQLEWQQIGSDYPFRAHQLSDGTLRFMCLAIALLQPNRPATLLFDEPELGLHPYALTLLANLFRQASASEQTQIILSTQSATLLGEFDPEHVIVVERTNGESTFRRLEASDLSEWIEDYTLGELWQKNVIGGRPRTEGAGEQINGEGAERS
jgi:predicted ATPase